MTSQHDEASLEQARVLLRRQGLRWTQGKAAVIQALIDDGCHLSAAAVHELVVRQVPEAQLSTVHRILVMLVENRLVHILGQSGGARYGLAGLPHHHFVCDGCGTTTSLPAEALNVALARACEEAGFRYGNSSTTVSGMCANCMPAAHFDASE